LYTVMDAKYEELFVEVSGEVSRGPRKLAFDNESELSPSFCATLPRGLAR